MSTGFFMGVRSSFREGTAPAAEAFLAAINQALSQNGSQPYRDPLQPPDVYNDSLFGRSELDNCSSETLAEGRMSRLTIVNFHESFVDL